jgi:hypothetical protein
MTHDHAAAFGLGAISPDALEKSAITCSDSSTLNLDVFFMGP